jgi:hypothetical protein
MPGAPLRNTEDAAYFVAWMERLISAARSSTAWNTEAEKQTVLATFEAAKQKYLNVTKQQASRVEKRRRDAIR